MPATFDDQLRVVKELLAEMRRMEGGERRHAAGPALSGYEKELRLAGLAQRIAQAYTIIEGVMGFIARRIDYAPVTGEDWHKKLIARCCQPFEESKRPALLSASLAKDLYELCEFRHVVRNIYPTRLDEPRVRENFDRLNRAARAFAAECHAFAALLPGRPPKKKRERTGPRNRSS